MPKRRVDLPLRLLYRPDWDQPAGWLPVVAHYLAGAEPGGDSVLHLDATLGPPPRETIAEMLAIVGDAIGGGRPCPEVTVLDERYDADGLIQVKSTADLRMQLGLESDLRPLDVEAMVEHAAHAKRLCDAVRRVLDNWRYQVATDPWTGRNPLVSVRIATWKGSETLVERAIPSALNGSYENVEVVVCSDGPDPQARAAVAALGDSRLRYVELPHRPTYPAQPWSFWQTAGIYAMNHALDNCVGAFIAPLDHDDAFTHDHIQVLLDSARASRADLVYGQAMAESRAATWQICGSAPLRHGHITHGSTLYSSRLAHMRMDPSCWLLDEPGDWNMWRRMAETQCEIRFVPKIVLAHFREQTAVATDPGTQARDFLSKTSEQICADLHRTGLDWLLDIPIARPGRHANHSGIA